MAVTSGYGLTSLSGTVSLNLAKAQGRLQTDVTRLSSGLRINTAADDPSGLAIAEALQSKVNGYDQAVGNIQDATNAATVAEGALQTTTDLLQRVRTLAVGAASDVLSSSDRANIQTEISQLLHEVDGISQNTNFNGVQLLDGTYSGSTPQQPATISIASNAVLALGTVAGPPVNLVSNPTFSNPVIPVGNTPLNGVVGGWQYITYGTLSNGNFDGLYRDNGATAGNVYGQPAPVPPVGGQAAYSTGNHGQFGGGVATHVDIIAGHTYTITLSAAGSATNEMQAALDYQTFTGPTLLPVNNVSFKDYTFQITASSTYSSSLYFTNDSSVAGTTAFEFISSVSVTDNDAPLPILSGLLVASAVAANTNFATTAGGVAGLGGTGTGDGTIELQVINTGASIAAQETFINSATGAISVSATLLAPNASSTIFDNVAITTGNFSSRDVGVTSYIKVGQNVPPVVGANPALEVQSGADEGDVLNVALPAVSASTLRIANVNVLSSLSGNPSLAAEDAIGQIDQALRTLLTQRAQLGAFMVRLSIDANNDNVTKVNLQASESNIRDENIAQTATAFAADQILSSIGTSVLANIKTQASLVEKFFQ